MPCILNLIFHYMDDSLNTKRLEYSIEREVVLLKTKAMTRLCTLRSEHKNQKFLLVIVFISVEAI